jgi:1,4-dihydroxy-2-naphthoate octaprenyltransferase
VTQSGLISAERVVVATGLVLALAAIPGLYLVWLGGPAFAALGLLAGISAVAYTAGPRPFGYLGLGELFVFVFFGPVAVIGTAYVMTQAVTPLAVWASVPMGCLVTAILVVNNLRDIETDRAAGKRTLAVRLGSGATRMEYAVLLGIAYLIPALMLAAGLVSGWVFLTWVTVPLAIVLTRQMWWQHGRALNPVLGGTARLALWYAVAFAVGLLR